MWAPGWGSPEPSTGLHHEMITSPSLLFHASQGHQKNVPCDLSGTLIPFRCNFPVFPQGDSRVQGQSVEVRVSEMNIITLFLSLCSFLF